ncbi:unnamed protein product [Rotaria magnacalcarata]|nr:unnamed protein product [Rotaria magnacalcarata]
MKVSIPRAVITRWNSQFMCVKRILVISCIELNEILAQLKYKNLCSHARNLSMLQEFVALLSLFAEATTATQRQNSPSISFVAPNLKKLILDHSLLLKRGTQTNLSHDTNSTKTHKEEQGCQKKGETVDSYNYISHEISKYNNDDNNDSMILINVTLSSSYKTLSQLAVKYLRIPATSAMTERTFSQSGFLFRPHRARMSRKTLP